MNLRSSVASVVAAAAAMGSVPHGASAFVVPSPSRSRAPTRLHLENHIAEMIDREADRLRNLKLWRSREEEKLRKGREPSLPSGFDWNSPSDTAFSQTSDAARRIQMRKDKRMAREDPARYCADRCVSTGNCQVWEDMFAMDAAEVQKFCDECVLSEEEEPCDVPEKFMEDAGLNAWELRP